MVYESLKPTIEEAGKGFDEIFELLNTEHSDWPMEKRLYVALALTNTSYKSDEKNPYILLGMDLNLAPYSDDEYYEEENYTVKRFNELLGHLEEKYKIHSGYFFDGEKQPWAGDLEPEELVRAYKESVEDPIIKVLFDVDNNHSIFIETHTGSLVESENGKFRIGLAAYHPNLQQGAEDLDDYLLGDKKFLRRLIEQDLRDTNFIYSDKSISLDDIEVLDAADRHGRIDIKESD